MNVKSFIFILIVSASSLYSQSLELYGDSNKTGGLKFNCFEGEFRFSLQEDKSNFGITATSEKFSSFPITIKAGNLSTGGSLSKLNSPLLSSSSSPFSTGISNVSGITASLPGYTSFTKPVSTFFQGAWSGKKNGISGIAVNCLYCPNEQQLAFSSIINSSLLNKKLKTSASITSGFFSYDESTSSSWFTQTPLYPQGNHFCSLYQLSIQYLNFYTGYTAGVYQTPFNTWSSLFRTDNKLSTSRFIFNFSGVYNPNYNKDGVITSSAKTLYSCLQLKNGLQYKFTTGKHFPVFVKSGFQSFLNLKLIETQHPVKLAAGTQITTGFFAVSLTCCSDFICNSQNQASINLNFDKISFQLKNTLYFNRIIPSFSCNFSLNPSEDYSSLTASCKFLISASFIQAPKINSSCSISFSRKDEEYSECKISMGITSTFNRKHLKIVLKFTADNTI